jgi:hypothetical protein
MIKFRPGAPLEAGKRRVGIQGSYRELISLHCVHSLGNYRELIQSIHE